MKKKWLIFLIGIFLISYTNALQTGICIEAKVTSINPSSVDSSEDFTVGIEITNCGDEIPKNISFEITRYSPQIIIKDPLFENIGTLSYTNSKRFLTYNMRTSKDIAPGVYVFETKLSYSSDKLTVKKEGNFSITVISDEPDLAISKIKTTPERVSPNEEVVLTIDIENSGDGVSKDTRVLLENLSFEGVKMAYIGTVGPDENIPARFILNSPSAGVYQGNVKIKYLVNSINKEINFPVKIQVFEKKDYKYWIIGGIVAILIIFYYFFKHYKIKVQEVDDEKE